jgi:hypothetical protein
VYNKPDFPDDQKPSLKPLALPVPDGAAVLHHDGVFCVYLKLIIP